MFYSFSSFKHRECHSLFIVEDLHLRTFLLDVFFEIFANGLMYFCIPNTGSIHKHCVQICNQSRAVFLKVRMLSSELSKRLSADEVMAAIKNAVLEMEAELRNALQSAESMKLEIETHDKLLKQLQKEWDVERTSLRGELASVKEQLTEQQQEQIGDRAKLVEAAAKVCPFFIFLLSSLNM